MSQTINKPIIPTLHSGVGILTRLDEMSAYALRAVISNPGKALQASEKESVSLRQVIYKFEQDPDLLCANLRNGIQHVMDNLTVRHAKGENVDITCEPRYYVDDPQKYDIMVSIHGQYVQNEHLKPFYTKNIFEITEDKILKLKLEGTPYVQQ